ncbi:hypothetical protein VQL36_20375 [Chengkuizengella sp. SCS-71B]|uniref:hypothetical protein n=1 Tax=Chengkuizengella sp. SCS-71B TaxID=3115290 RepID=UPI0032C231A7
MKNIQINRGDLAVLFTNTLGQYISNVDEAIQYLLDNGISQGKTDVLWFMNDTYPFENF